MIKFQSISMRKGASEGHNKINVLMKNRFAELGFGASMSLEPLTFDAPAPQQPVATAKPSFMGARPALLLPQTFQVPTITPMGAPPISTRGPGPIQLPITPCSQQTFEPYQQPFTSFEVLHRPMEPQYPDETRGGSRHGVAIRKTQFRKTQEDRVSSQLSYFAKL